MVISGYMINECRKESHRKKSHRKIVRVWAGKKSPKKSHRIGFDLVFLSVVLLISKCDSKVLTIMTDDRQGRISSF